MRLDHNIDLNSDGVINVLDELPLWSAPFGLKLLENIRIRKNITALDIGFGAGFPLIEIAMRLGESSTIYGIDPWKEATKRVKKKINIYGIKNITIITGTAENILLPDNSVNLITSNNGINNVSDIEKTLNECLRIMKKGGQFVQTFNLNNTMKEFYDLLRLVLKEKKLDSSLKMVDEHIFEKRKPLDMFVRQVEQAGFSIDNIIHDSFEYRFADGTTMLNHFFVRLAFLESWKAIVPTEKLVEVFERVEELMNISAEKDGIFRLNIPFVLIDSTKRRS